MTIEIEAVPDNSKTGLVSTELLGSTIISEVPYMDTDGTSILLNKDFFGNDRNNNPTPGPFKQLKEGTNTFILNLKID